LLGRPTLRAELYITHVHWTRWTVQSDIAKEATDSLHYRPNVHIKAACPAGLNKMASGILEWLKKEYGPNWES